MPWTRSLTRLTRMTSRLRAHGTSDSPAGTPFGLPNQNQSDQWRIQMDLPPGQQALKRGLVDLTSAAGVSGRSSSSIGECRKLGRMGWLVSLAMAAVAPCVVAYAGDLPNLPDTRLYRELAHDCHSVDLTRWNHPTKQVLRKYHVKLYALELCNTDTYPIFHVDFDFDPMALTDSFFVPFYDAMFTANSRNAMAFVETKSGNAIVMISNDHGRPKAEYELYKS